MPKPVDNLRYKASINIKWTNYQELFLITSIVVPFDKSCAEMHLTEKD